MLNQREKNWLLLLSEFAITVELVFEVLGGELYVTPIVSTPELRDDLGTYLVDDPKWKLAIFKYTKLLYRLSANKPLNKSEQILVDTEDKIRNKIEYFRNYIEVHEISKVGQLPKMLLGFGYTNMTKQIGKLFITEPIQYIGVDHHRKIFCYFNGVDGTIGKQYRMKNALYLY